MTPNPLCAFRRRQLARAAVLGGAPPCGPRLAAHLDRCDSCRQDWETLRQLSDVLAGALYAPGPSAHFVRGVEERLPERAWGLRPGMATLCVAATVAIALLAARAGHFPPPGGSRSPGEPATRVAIASVPPPRVQPASARSLPSRVQRSGGQKPARARRLVLRLATRPRSRMRSAAPSPSPGSADSWALCGLAADRQGDHLAAAAAYRQAYARTGVPGLALAAGHSAEQGGDMAEAIDRYAEFLSGDPAAAADDKVRAPGGVGLPGE